MSTVTRNEYAQHWLLASVRDEHDGGTVLCHGVELVRVFSAKCERLRFQCRFTVSFCQSALLFNIKSLPGNRYVNALLLGVLLLPINWVQLPASRW